VSRYPRCPRPVIGGRPPRSSFDSLLTMGVGELRARSYKEKAVAQLLEAKTAKGSGMPVLEFSSARGC